MGKPWQVYDREQLLADVAEMYFEESLTQQQIADRVGLTRSAISRLLNEARSSGVVEIHIRRRLCFDDDLSAALVHGFNLQSAQVVRRGTACDEDRLPRILGLAGARVLSDLLTPHSTIGVTWGYTVSATVDALEDQEVRAARVVQVVGSLSGFRPGDDARDLVERLARVLQAEPSYLPAPLLMPSAASARALCSSPTVRRVIELGRTCDVMLLGIGSVDPEHSRLYREDFIDRATLDGLLRTGAVGVSCGFHFDHAGRPVAPSFHNRLVGLSREEMLNIKVRLAIAGGKTKVAAIRSVLLSGFATIMVTDSATAIAVLNGS